MQKYLIKKPAVKRAREEDPSAADLEPPKKKLEIDPLVPPSQFITKCLLPTLDDSAPVTSFTTAFEEIATFIAHHVVLQVAGKHLSRIAEFEFYYTTTSKAKTHPDPFTHQFPDQLKSGCWYFHRQNASPSAPYRVDTYKGLDIVIGNSEKKIYGGILIRSLLRRENKEWRLVEGPCNCVDFILKENAVESIDILVNNMEEGLEIEKNSKFLQLKLKSDLDKQQRVSLFPSSHYTVLYTSGRVGITLKKSELWNERVSFIMKPYRYFLCPREMKKGKAYMICEHFRREFLKPDDKAAITPTVKHKLSQIYNVTSSTVDTYLKDFIKGSKLKDAEKFRGQPVTVSSTCELSGFCSK